MPSFVVHGVVPTLLLLAVGFTPRRVLLLLPLTFLPDLDFALGVHRASLHNVFILLPGAVWAWAESRYGEGWERAEWGVIATVYLGSHLLMDVFTGGIVLLWPVVNRALFVWVAVLVHTDTLSWELVLEPGTLVGPPVTSEVYTWLAPSEAAMLVLLAVGVVVWALVRWRALRQGDDEAPQR